MLYSCNNCNYVIWGHRVHILPITNHFHWPQTFFRILLVTQLVKKLTFYSRQVCNSMWHKYEIIRQYALQIHSAGHLKKKKSLNWLFTGMKKRPGFVQWKHTFFESNKNIPNFTLEILYIHLHFKYISRALWMCI
jgi:hypothetical protein